MKAQLDIASLLEQAFPVQGNAETVAFLPEAQVKTILTGIRVSPRRPVPPSIVPPEIPGALRSSVTALRGQGVRSEDLIHKSDLGAVKLGILSAADATREAETMAARLVERGITPKGFLVEQQQPAGLEMIVGVVRRPPFGLMVAVGFGGTLTEILHDVAHCAPGPIDAAQAEAMLTELKAAKLFDGVRGRPPIDRAALTRLICRVGGKDGAAAHLGQHLAEIEINPVIVTASGAVAVDGRLLLHRKPAQEIQRTADDGFRTALHAAHRGDCRRVDEIA